jgi:NitT/TauT family transport system substrate-binding protein
VRVAFAPGEAAASLVIAERLGAFARQGVEVEWQARERPADALPELASDALDVAVARVSVTVFALIVRGGRVRIVADRGQQRVGGCALNAVMLRRGLDPQRLPRPLRVATTPATVGDFLLDRLRAEHQGADDWSIVDLPSMAMPQALAAGAIDVVLANEPHLTRLRDAGLADVWRTYAEIYPDMQHYMLLFGPRLLDRQRDLGARFLAAYLEGERTLAGGKTDRNVELMADALELDPELVRRICWAPVSDDLGVNAESLLAFQRWAVEKGLLDRVVAAEEFWDGQPAAQAVRLAAGSSSR